MSAPTLTQPSMVDAWRSPRGGAVVIGAGLIVLGLLFHAEVAAAVETWIDSTAYNHCFLVVPIVGYLIWDRRTTLRGATAEPMPLMALAGIPLALAWLLAERLGVMEGRQLVAMSFVELLLFAVLGRRLWWLLAGPLLYLYFLVPFGDFMTPKLQDFTTVFVRYGVDILGIPAYIDHYTIEIPEGTFYIAEACAGLRFLIASIAFGCLYSLLMYRSPVRRVVFIAASVIVPIIANGFRALGIVGLGHILGSAQAAATDHVLYGWIFFSIVILVLIGLGLPFREDQVNREPPVAPDAARHPSAPTAWAPTAWRNALVAGGIVVVLAAISPTVAMALNRAGTGTVADVPRLDLGPGCTDIAAGAPVALNLRGQMVSRRIACPGMTLDVNIDVLPRHSTAGPLVGEEHRLTMLQTEEDTELGWLPTSPGQPRIWRMVKVPQRGPLVAYALMVDGRPAPGALAMRTRMAWTSVVGARVAPVLITVAPVLNWQKLQPEARDDLEKRLATLLLQPDVLAQMGRLGAAR